jgi:hypothetical protein
MQTLPHDRSSPKSAQVARSAGQTPLWRGAAGTDLRTLPRSLASSPFAPSLRSRMSDPPSHTSCMSFRDLFELAHGRPWTPEEHHRFQTASQDERNRLVKQLAAQAGGIAVEDRIGSDGQTYTAFWRR